MSCEISTYRKTKGKRSTEQVCVCKQLALEMSRTEILVASSCIDMTDKYRPQNQTTSPVRRSTTTNNYALLKIHQPLTSVRVWHGNVQAYSLRFPAEFIQTPPPLLAADYPHSARTCLRIDMHIQLSDIARGGRIGSALTNRRFNIV